MRARASSKTWLVSLLVAIATLLVAPAFVMGQDSPFDVDTGEKKETKIAEFEKKKVERKTIAEEEGDGPIDQGKAVNPFEGEVQKFKKDAIRLMEITIQETDPADEEYPLLLERLADMYWSTSKYHELEAFDRLQESRDAEDAGNATLAAELKTKSEEHTAESVAFRDKAIETLGRLVDEYPLYENSDRALFYYAFNLADSGRLEDANNAYKQLVREYPDTKYIADAYLGLAEYSYLVDEDMDKALDEYDLVVQSAPGTPAAGYAMYKQGWAYFNLGEPKKALAQFELVIKEAGSDEQLAREARKELVKAYSLWTEGKASKAKGYLKKYADNDQDLNDMMERLARLYQEDGQIEKSNYVYNQLIKDNSKDYKIIGYQIEIMLNTETMNIPDRTARRDRPHDDALPQSQGHGVGGSHAGNSRRSTTSSSRSTRARLRSGITSPRRQRRTRCTTRSPTRSTAHTWRTSRRRTDNYRLMYYYAELLYWKKNWPEAAKRYDQVLDIDENGSSPRTPLTALSSRITRWRRPRATNVR